MPMKKTSDDGFAGDVLNAGKPVVVDFWAEWCAPCKQLAPFLDEIAEEFGEQIDVVKLNIDDNPDTTLKYGVRGIPTLMIFKDGEAVATNVGVLPKTRLAKWVSDNV